MGYALSTTVAHGFDDTLQRTRSALADQGFGVLTEIDIQATLKAKLDVATPAQVILGACRLPPAAGARGVAGRTVHRVTAAVQRRRARPR